MAQMEPDSDAYNLSAPLSLSGHLNVAALEQGVGEVVRRHETLRTIFTAIDGQPLQRIEPPQSRFLPIVDLTGLSTTSRENVAAKLVNHHVQQPFALTRGPLLRTHLIYHGNQEYVLLFTMHHIISDGWSLGIFVREATTLYENFATGVQSTLSEMPFQYADFAYWQREWLKGDILNTQLAFWKEHLGGAPDVLQLPVDHSRPDIQTFKGNAEIFETDSDLLAKLKMLAQRADVTLYMLLLAAYTILLSRYSGQEDMVVGSAVAGRGSRALESHIGFFANTLAIRVNLSGNPTFRDFLTRVRHIVLRGLSHQDLPLEHLIEELRPERNLSYNPLFQVFFVLKNAPAEEVKLSNLVISPLEVERKMTMFDLSLALDETRQGLRGVLQYNSGLFEVSTVKRMCQRYQVLLEKIVEDADMALMDLKMDQALPDLPPIVRVE